MCRCARRALFPSSCESGDSPGRWLQGHPDSLGVHREELHEAQSGSSSLCHGGHAVAELLLVLALLAQQRRVREDGTERQVLRRGARGPRDT